jgi:hypothetical protein
MPDSAPIVLCHECGDQGGFAETSRHNRWHRFTHILAYRAPELALQVRDKERFLSTTRTGYGP